MSSCRLSSALEDGEEQAALKLPFTYLKTPDSHVVFSSLGYIAIHLSSEPTFLRSLVILSSNLLVTG